MHEGIYERAQELGRVLGQTDEFKALQRAREAISADRELTTLLNSLADLESQVAQALQQGQEPPADVGERYEASFSELQGSALYQSLVAGQANFDKILKRVNEEISKGMESGSRSRIILPS